MGQKFCQRVRELRSLISAVGEQRLQKGKHPEQGRHNENAAIAILNVGRMNDGVVFGRTGRFRATETAQPHLSDGKAAESQRLFRTRQETGIAQDCVVELAGVERVSKINGLLKGEGESEPLIRLRYFP